MGESMIALNKTGFGGFYRSRGFNLNLSWKIVQIANMNTFDTFIRDGIQSNFPKNKFDRTQSILPKMDGMKRKKKEATF